MRLSLPLIVFSLVSTVCSLPMDLGNSKKPELVWEVGWSLTKPNQSKMVVVGIIYKQLLCIPVYVNREVLRHAIQAKAIDEEQEEEEAEKGRKLYGEEQTIVGGLHDALIQWKGSRGPYNQVANNLMNVVNAKEYTPSDMKLEGVPLRTLIRYILKHEKNYEIKNKDGRMKPLGVTEKIMWWDTIKKNNPRLLPPPPQAIASPHLSPPASPPPLPQKPQAIASPRLLPSAPPSSKAPALPYPSSSWSGILYPEDHVLVGHEESNERENPGPNLLYQPQGSV